MAKPIVAVPRPGATAADRRAVAQANALRAQDAKSRPSIVHDVVANALHRLVGKPGLGGAAQDAVKPIVNFAQHPGLGSGVQALAALPIGIGGRGAAVEHPSPYLYHGTTHENALQIQARGHIEPNDVRQEGQAFTWLTADPHYAAMYGPHVIRVPRANLPPGSIRSRVGPESYAVSSRVPIH
jgi:hypothetical protein